MQQWVARTSLVNTKAVLLMGLQVFSLSLRTQKMTPVYITHEWLVPGSVALEGSKDLWTQLRFQR